MAICICAKHGRAGFAEACPHVAEAVDKGNVGRFHRLCVPPAALLVCDDCFRKYGFADFKEHPGVVGKCAWDIDDDLMKLFYDAHARLEGRTGRCAECIDAAQVSLAKHRVE